MSDNAEFKEDVAKAVRIHDPGPEAIRALATNLQELADRQEQSNEVLL